MGVKAETVPPLFRWCRRAVIAAPDEARKSQTIQYRRWY